MFWYVFLDKMGQNLQVTCLDVFSSFRKFRFGPAYALVPHDLMAVHK